MCHEKAKNGLFAYRNVRKKNVTESYYGPLAYADLRRKSEIAKRYEEQYIKITAELFCRFALALSGVVTESGGAEASGGVGSGSILCYAVHHRLKVRTER